MQRHGERRERPVWSPQVHTRFEPSRLAETCLSDAYARLVPLVRRQVRTAPCAQAFGLGLHTCPQDTRDVREEGRQCS
jgi:hypothetical protein